MDGMAAKAVCHIHNEHGNEFPKILLTGAKQNSVAILGDEIHFHPRSLKGDKPYHMIEATKVCSSISKVNQVASVFIPSCRWAEQNSVEVQPRGHREA